MQIKIMNYKELTNNLNTIPSNTAVISFYNNEDTRVALEKTKINYIQKNIIDIRYVEKPEEFHQQDFIDIVKFIKKHYALNYNFICQCEAGYSRSAACAAAISEYYTNDGIKYFADYKYYPNQLFFNIIYNLLKK